MNLSFQKAMYCKRIRKMYNRIMGVKIKKVIWDGWNSVHIQKHDTGIKEIENALKDKNKIFIKSYNERIVVFCKTEDRMLAVVIAEDEKDIFYIVTARDMDKREREYYRDNEKNTTKI
jgi:uncharacterized DUF497 family protein